MEQLNVICYDFCDFSIVISVRGNKNVKLVSENWLRNHSSSKYVCLFFLPPDSMEQEQVDSNGKKESKQNWKCSK